MQVHYLQGVVVTRPSTVHCVAQHFTSFGLQPWFMQATAQPAPLHSTLPLQACEPSHVMSVLATFSALMSLQACSPIHFTTQLAVPVQSILSQACLPTHVITQDPPGGHFTFLQSLSPASGQAIVHVAPLHVPPAFAHDCPHATLASSFGFGGRGFGPSVAPLAASEPGATGAAPSSTPSDAGPWNVGSLRHPLPRIRMRTQMAQQQEHERLI